MKSCGCQMAEGRVPSDGYFCIALLSRYIYTSVPSTPPRFSASQACTVFDLISEQSA